MNENFLMQKKIHLIFLKKIIFKKEKIKLYHIIIFIIFTYINLTNSIIDENDLNESIYSYINLKIGEGNHNVYSVYTPDIVYINENKQITLGPTYNFNESENSVILIWKKPITNCQSMFQHCDKINELDLTHFDTSEVTIMTFMFDGCFNLKFINLSNIDTSKVQNMGVMFENCRSLTSLDVSNFNTAKNINFGGMFQGCSLLKSIDITNFVTSTAHIFNSIFEGCSSLTSVDLSNFDTSRAEYMNNMFQGCISLTSINISNFKTEHVMWIDNMFNGCTSLTLLDFRNMDLSSVEKEEKMSNMFYGCKNLEYVNIQNYIPKYNNINKFFIDCPINIVICMNNEELIDRIKTDECNIFNCSDNWSEFKNKITENNECTNNCLTTSYLFEYNFKCYINCPKGTYNMNFKTIKNYFMIFLIYCYIYKISNTFHF